MEISSVRNRLTRAIEQARDEARQRRSRVASAEQAYATFLQNVAIPVARMVANALKVEGYAFSVFTPGDGLRLSSDRSRDDYIELLLDTTGTQPQVLGRVSRTRGSRILSDERPVREGIGPEALTEDDILTFLLAALAPWLER